MRHIRCSLPAVDDPERICERIEIDNPEAARRVAQTIYNGCERLGDLPYIGRPDGGAARTAFPPLPYIAVYTVTDSAVEIGRILHGAQDWPQALLGAPAGQQS